MEEIISVCVKSPLFFLTNFFAYRKGSRHCVAFGMVRGMRGRREGGEREAQVEAVETGQCPTSV